MADAAKRPNRARKWQGRIAVVVFSLFPLAVLAGLLSPGVIALQTQTGSAAAESAAPAAPAGPLDFRGVNLNRSPLLVPREQFDALQAVDPMAWRREVIEHEELFIDLHDHLPPEMIYERELLIGRL
jgi:hypothetical protein